MKKELILLILLLAVAVCNAQTGKGTKTTILETSRVLTLCDTCVTSTGIGIISNIFGAYKGQPTLRFQEPTYDFIFRSQPYEVIKIHRVDYLGIQKGWFDKRFVKFTSDSTFIILSK